MAHQDTPLKYSPVSGKPRWTGITAKDYRNGISDRVWAFNPWTSEPRNPQDIETDPYGHLIIPPGEEVVAAVPETESLETGETDAQQCQVLHGVNKASTRCPNANDQHPECGCHRAPMITAKITEAEAQKLAESMGTNPMYVEMLPDAQVVKYIHVDNVSVYVQPGCNADALRKAARFISSLLEK